MPRLFLARPVPTAAHGPRNGFDHYAGGLRRSCTATNTGSEVQRPLATAVVGGLVSTTFLTRFVLPTMCGFIARRADFPPGLLPSTRNRTIEPNEQDDLTNGSEPQ